MVKKVLKALTGAECVAEAMRQINPDVVAAYPITPQTPIMHAFSQFVADGKVDTEFVTVESEHSAMSATVGASAAGSRAMTATSSNGLALMWEVVHIAASTRLPIVMNVVNRALSGPINIHCDHSDSMGCRDAGWIQLYSETGEEAYHNTIMAVRIAEHPDVLLPVMVCQDGFITSHSVETSEILDDETVKNFIGEHNGHHPLLKTENPVTVGPLDLFDYYFEHKRQQLDAMERAKPIIQSIFDEFGAIVGRKIEFFEPYMLDDAEEAVICLSSSCGTLRHVVDELRKQGRKVGLLKVRVFRPFDQNKLAEMIRHIPVVGVMDRSASFGAFGGPVFMEVRNAIADESQKPLTVNYIYGLGGREFTVEQAKQVFDELRQVRESGNPGIKVRTLGVRE
ncbi:pyruvate ferredoxin oxidoreductase [Candidatus Woesearchaeota archaeon]|nr:MAG: pyruvate ferredoxin oxidoreductase [Candidatus Woesearchaeota archaeon]